MGHAWIDTSPRRTYRWPINIWKDTQCHQSSERCKLKSQWDITSHLSEWLSSINPQMTSAREDIEKREPSLTVWEPIWKTVLGTALPGVRSCNPPWLRLSQRPWDHKLLRRQSLSPWQGCHLCPLYFTLLGPELDQLANDG